VRSTVRYLIGIILSALLIWLAFRDIDLQELIGHFTRLSWKPIALCFIGQLIFQILHWIRWGLVLRQFGWVSWDRVFIMGAIGNAALYLLPVRAGELVRPTLAAGEKEVNLGQTTATSAIERIVDGLLVSAILFGALLTLGGDYAPQTIYRSGIAFLSIFIGVFFVIYFGNKHQDVVINLLSRTMGRLSPYWTERVINLYINFIQAIRVSATSNILLPYVGLSIALWLIDITSIYWLFGILNIELSFIAASVVISILALGSLIPSGPAQLGVFEFSIVIGLGIFSISQEEAVLVGTVFHIIVIGLVLVLGLIGLWLNQIRINSGVRD